MIHGDCCVFQGSFSLIVEAWHNSTKVSNPSSLGKFRFYCDVDFHSEPNPAQAQSRMFMYASNLQLKLAVIDCMKDD